MKRFALLVCVLSASTANADLLGIAFQPQTAPGGAAPQPTTPPPPPSTTEPEAAQSLQTWAGDPTAITLAELIKVAIAQTPSLRSAQFDIQIAEAQIEQTFGRDDWRIQSRVDASRATGGVFGGFVVDHSTQVTGSFDAIKPLPTGGTVDLHAETQYSNTKLVGLPDENKQWFDGLSVAVTQPILRGYGRALFEANERRARVARDVAVLGKRVAAIAAVQQVVAAYWDLVLAERQIAITQSSLDLARERLRVTTIGSTGGKIAKAEIPAVEQIIATREEDVLATELAILDRSITLRRAAGMQIGPGQLGLRVGTELDIPDASPTLNDLVERAYQASPELAQLEKQTAVDTIDIEVTENGLLPQLDAALSFGPTGQDATFGKAVENTVTFDQYAITGSLNFSHTIGNQAVRGRARELRLVREKRRVTAADLRAQIAQAMARSVAQLELAKRRVVLSRRAIALAQQNIQIEIDRFNLGKSTNFDVLNRQEELRQAELRQAQAMVDWHKAETSIAALTGDILPQFGITLP